MPGPGLQRGSARRGPPRSLCRSRGPGPTPRGCAGVPAHRPGRTSRRAGALARGPAPPPRRRRRSNVDPVVLRDQTDRGQLGGVARRVGKEVADDLDDSPPVGHDRGKGGRELDLELVTRSSRSRLGSSRPSRSPSSGYSSTGPGSSRRRSPGRSTCENNHAREENRRNQQPMTSHTTEQAFESTVESMLRDAGWCAGDLGEWDGRAGAVPRARRRLHPRDAARRVGAHGRPAR